VCASFLWLFCYFELHLYVEHVFVIDHSPFVARCSQVLTSTSILEIFGWFIIIIQNIPENVILFMILQNKMSRFYSKLMGENKICSYDQ
jgi:hypothetical protein